MRNGVPPPYGYCQLHDWEEIVPLIDEAAYETIAQHGARAPEFLLQRLAEAIGREDDREAQRLDRILQRVDDLQNNPI